MRSRLASAAILALAALSCGTPQPSSVRAAAAVPPIEAYCGELPCSWFDEPGACQYLADWLQLGGGPYTDVRLVEPVYGENSVTQDGHTYSINLVEGPSFDWSATRPVSFVVAASGHDANVYRYPAPVSSDTNLVAWNNQAVTQVLFCLETYSPPQGSLSASATASAGFTRRWAWQITKASPAPTVTASVDAAVAVTWSVSVLAAPVDSAWNASGTLVITNPSTIAVSGVTLDASFAGAPVVPTCPAATPLTVPAGGSVTCTWSAAESAAVDGTFVATVSSPEIAGPAGATATATFGSPTAEPDGCVTVTDSLAGLLGTVCATAGDPAARVAPATFVYVRDAGPYATCDATSTAYSVSNTATYTAPSGATGSSTFVVGVRVPCASTGCTLTQGYWKTHSQEGPAPYDTRWKNVGPLEEDTVFFLSGKTWIEVFRTPVKGNPYYALAHQYMAARLNVLAGASADALGNALASAEAFFAANGPGTSLTAAQKAEVLALAGLLDAYNHGKIGPGHCDDAEAGGGKEGDDEAEDRCHDGHDHDGHERCRKHEREDKAHGRCGDHRKHDDCRKHDGDDRRKRDACGEAHERRCRDEEEHEGCRDHGERERRSGCHDRERHVACRDHDEKDRRSGCDDRERHAARRDHDEKDRRSGCDDHEKHSACRDHAEKDRRSGCDDHEKHSACRDHAEKDGEPD